MSDTDTLDPLGELVTEAVNANPETGMPDKLRRGDLEREVKDVTDRFANGEFVLPEGKTMLTPQLIATEIKRTREANGVDRREPSTGAIADNLKRWSSIGFAVTTAEKPLAFLGYTDDGYAFGLTAMKERSWAAKAEERRAANPPQEQGATDGDGFFDPQGGAPVDAA